MKTIRKRSPLPFLGAGIVFFLYGLRNPMSRFGEYLLAAVLAFLTYWICRMIWKDRLVKQELPPQTGDVQCDTLILDARKSLEAIRAANDAIADPALSGTIDAIESSTRVILNRLEEKPDLQPQLRTFLRYYLPTTCKILDARALLEPGDKETSSAKQTRARTERMLLQINTAFGKQVDALEKHRYLDIQVEMDVLEGMLKSEGITITKGAEQ
ncbi:MAG TPA: 5-bromo-4-chloroindolyl phosphate hydrolysis family protein [Clostridia bacterium]|nr:5-bromo-4-chloroindolyl phosphate hydrolysis family protein [Clostridia bacterium]